MSEANERKLFAGTLRGYRHYAVRTPLDVAMFSLIERKASPFRYAIDSPANPYRWRDGENIAQCSIYAEFSTPDMARQLDDRIEELEQGVNARYIDVTAFCDPSTVYITDPGELRHLRTIRAEAERYRAGEHNLKGCHCGFYVSYSPQADFYPCVPQTHVHAVVETYGRIVLGTKGFRAQKLRIIAMAPWYRGCTNEGGFRPPRIPHYVQARAVRDQLPGVQWFDSSPDMIREYPQPDRGGLVPDVNADYGAGR